jgi:uncharacterized protein (DUF433 family)
VIQTFADQRADLVPIFEVMQQFPVTREQVTAVLEFAARSLDAPVPGR